MIIIKWVQHGVGSAAMLQVIQVTRGQEFISTISLFEIHNFFSLFEAMFCKYQILFVQDLVISVLNMKFWFVLIGFGSTRNKDEG